MEYAVFVNRAKGASAYVGWGPGAYDPPAELPPSDVCNGWTAITKTGTRGEAKRLMDLVLDGDASIEAAQVFEYGEGRDQYGLLVEGAGRAGHRFSKRL